MLTETAPREFFMFSLRESDVFAYAKVMLLRSDISLREVIYLLTQMLLKLLDLWSKSNFHLSLITYNS